MSDSCNGNSGVVVQVLAALFQNYSKMSETQWQGTILCLLYIISKPHRHPIYTDALTLRANTFKPGRDVYFSLVIEAQRRHGLGTSLPSAEEKHLGRRQTG